MTTGLNRGRTGIAAGIVTMLCCETGAQAALEISCKATSNVTCSGGVCTATAKKAVLNVTDLTNMLGSGDVKVASGSLAQDIAIHAAFSWASTKRLTLDSFHYIRFYKPIAVTGAGALTILTNDGYQGNDWGDFIFVSKAHVEFWDETSSLIINGKTFHLVKGIREIAKDLRRRHGEHLLALSQSFDIGKHGPYFNAPLPNLGTIFEGLGNEIRNLSINDSTDNDHVGLAAQATGPVRDLNLTSVNIIATGKNQIVGMIAGSEGYEGDYEARSGGCRVQGTIQAGESAIVGGVFGIFGERAIGGWWRADVVIAAGDNSEVGGLVGYNADGRIEQSFATGSISVGLGSSSGGLVGKQDSPYDYFRGVWNSYSTASVTSGSNSAVGGLIGNGLQTGEEGAFLEYSYSTGTVTAGADSAAGGDVGEDANVPRMNNVYWDMDTSGISNPHQGAGNIPDDPGITGLADTQLKSGLPSGFDSSIWAQNPNSNNGYPYLLANPPPK